MSGGRDRVVTKVTAKQVATCQDSGVPSDFTPVKITFRKEGLAGKGTFGVVQKVQLLKVVPAVSEEDTSKAVQESLAMKTVVVKCRKNRELLMLRKVRHPNIVQLRYFFFSHAKTSGETLLNIFFDLQPTTVHDMINQLLEREETWPKEDVAEYGYQIADGLQYLHSLGIAHRDIKPRNLLLRPDKKTVQICDLGSACFVQQGLPLTAYICSRYSSHLVLCSTGCFYGCFFSVFP